MTQEQRRKKLEQGCGVISVQKAEVRTGFQKKVRKWSDESSMTVPFDLNYLLRTSRWNEEAIHSYHRGTARS